MFIASFLRQPVELWNFKLNIECLNHSLYKISSHDKSPSFLHLYDNNNGSIASVVSLWYRPCHKNMLNYDNDNKCGKITAK